jgi:hypothetical protein
MNIMVTCLAIDDAPLGSAGGGDQRTPQKADAADQHRLAAGILLQEARDRLEVEQPGTSWPQWCATNIERSYGDVMKCLRLAGAPDPAAAHAAERVAARQSDQKYRQKKKQSVSPETLSNGEATTPDSIDADLRMTIRTMTLDRLVAFRDWLLGYCQLKGI